MIVRESDIYLPHPGEDDMCAFCFKPVELPAVFWTLGGGMFFHCPCAAAFGLQLLSDAQRMTPTIDLRAMVKQ